MRPPQFDVVKVEDEIDIRDTRYACGFHAFSTQFTSYAWRLNVLKTVISISQDNSAFYPQRDGKRVPATVRWGAKAGWLVPYHVDKCADGR